MKLGVCDGAVGELYISVVVLGREVEVRCKGA